MNKETLELIAWAESYKPEINSFQLNEFVFVEDLEKCLTTLVKRTKRVDKIPVFIAYRDNLKEIKDFLEKN